MIYYFEEIELFQRSYMERAFPYLSEQRKEKVIKYRYFKDKRLSVLAYLLLRYGLKKEYGMSLVPEFDLGSFGKPYLSGHNAINFNLSHCDQGIVCAIDRETVGIDITEIKKENLTIFEAMSFLEKEKIKSSAKPEKQITIFWSLKESYLKYLGLGIDKYLSELDFSSVNQNTFYFREKLFQIFENKNAIITLCSNQKMKIRKVNTNEILAEL